MKPATETCEWDIPTRSHMLTCTHSSQLTHSHVYSHMGSHTPAHTCTLQTCSDTCSHTHGFHTCSDVGSCTYTLTRLLTRALHTCSHISIHTSTHTSPPHQLTYTLMHRHHHTCTLSHTHTLTQHMQTHIDPSDTPETPIPDGDHIPTVTLDVPAAVGAWGVVEGPGRAVDDTAPFCVLLQFPTAGSCQERRLRSTGLTFG